MIASRENQLDAVLPIRCRIYRWMEKLRSAVRGVPSVSFPGGSADRSIPGTSTVPSHFPPRRVLLGGRMALLRGRTGAPALKLSSVLSLFWDRKTPHFPLITPKIGPCGAIYCARSLRSLALKRRGNAPRGPFFLEHFFPRVAKHPGATKLGLKWKNQNVKSESRK